MRRVPLEICIDCTAPETASLSIDAALRGGASRVELCADMSRDGLTPAPEFCRIARRLFGDNNGVLAMIRPTADGFSYASETILIMLEQIDAAAEAGADGVVFGPLDRQGEIDRSALERLCAAAKRHNLTTTFHRAFDALGDREGAVRILVDHGIDRVLTSGTPWGSGKGASEGVGQIRRTVESAAGQIEVVIGGGISLTTLKAIRPLIGLGGISIHSYAGVLTDGRVDVEKVRRIAEQLTLQDD